MLRSVLSKQPCMQRQFYFRKLTSNQRVAEQHVLSQKHYNRQSVTLNTLRVAASTSRTFRQTHDMKVLQLLRTHEDDTQLVMPAAAAGGIPHAVEMVRGRASGLSTRRTVTIQKVAICIGSDGFICWHPPQLQLGVLGRVVRARGAPGQGCQLRLHAHFAATPRSIERSGAALKIHGRQGRVCLASSSDSLIFRYLPAGIPKSPCPPTCPG